jgi:hypothetical protein
MNQEKSMLKYENVAQPGDVIRAYDFERMSDRRDRYVEGTVINRKLSNEGYVYVIRCEIDEATSGKYSRVGCVVHVPFETTFDFDGRVVLVEKVI